MEELLTIDEIERRHQNEWVVMVDIVEDPGPVIRRARVAWHGISHDDAWNFVDSLPKPTHAGVFYMGPVVDEDVALVL